MRNPSELIGIKKDYLVITGYETGMEGYKTRLFIICQCICGKQRRMTLKDFKKSTHKNMSCGCMRKNGFIDGRRKMPEWKVYLSMKSRCNNPNNKAYKWYGGRGIKVCNRWMKDFKFFLKDMGFRPSNKHSIDRIDVDGNYCKKNCRWATRKEQANNTRRSILYKIKLLLKT